MKKKIIISNYDDISNPYYGGGGARAIHEVAKRLAKTHSITIITGNYPGAKNTTIDGVLYKRIGLKSAGPKIGQLLFQVALLKEARRQEYDVWIESLTPPFSASLLPFIAKKSVIGLVHMLAGEDMQRKYYLPFTFFEHVGLRFYKNFIVTQKVVGMKIKKFNKIAKVSIIPNGVTVPTLQLANRKNSILYLGRIEVNQKGLDLLLDMFSKTNLENIKLNIAGSGEKSEVEKLKKLILKNNLSRRISLVGKVKDVKKKDLFEKAYCTVVSSRFETFSLVSLESMSYKVPVVCFDIQGLSWLPKNTCIKIKPYDVDEMALSITNFINNKKIQKELSNQGYEFVKKLNWDSISKKYMKIVATN